MTLTAGLRPAPFEPPPQHQQFTAEFKDIQESLLGNSEFNYYMFQALRIGHSTESISRTEIDGKPAYRVETVDNLHLGPVSFVESNTVLLKIDFSMISRDTVIEEHNRLTDVKTRLQVTCTGQGMDQQTCEYREGNKETETVTYKTPDGAPITFQQLLARALSWDKAPVLTAYTVYDDTRTLEQYVMSQNGTQMLPGGNGASARVISFTFPRGNLVPYTLWLNDERGDLGGEVMPGETDAWLVLRADMTQPDVSGRPDPGALSPEKLTPTQAAAAMEIASLEGDTERFMEFFDTQCLYDFLSENMPPAELPDYDTFRSEIMDDPPNMSPPEAFQGMQLQFPDYDMHTIVDVYFHYTLNAEVDGDSAVLRYLDGAPPMQMYRYDGVWKVCFLDQFLNQGE